MATKVGEKALVKKFLTDLDCELLACDDVRPRFNKLSFKCPQGHIQDLTWKALTTRVKEGQTCLICKAVKEFQQHLDKYDCQLIKLTGNTRVLQRAKNTFGLHFKCKHGHENTIKWRSFEQRLKKGYVCDGCHMADKRVALLRKFGCELVSFNGYDTDFTFRCQKGHETTLRWTVNFRDRIKRIGQPCFKCRAEENVVQALTEHNCELLVLDGAPTIKSEGIAESSNVGFKCQQGHRTLVSWKVLCSRITRRGYACRSCRLSKASPKRRLNYVPPYTQEEAEKIFADKSCELLDKLITYSSHKLVYRCECGKLAKSSMRRFMERKNVCRCTTKTGPLVKEKVVLTQKEVEKAFADRGCELLDTFQNTTRHKMFYKCKCGGTGKLTLARFLKRKYRCDDCWARHNKPLMNNRNLLSRDLASVKICSEIECGELLIKARAGDGKARNKLIESISRWVWKIAAEFHDLNKKYDFEELLAEAYLTTSDTILKWEPTRGKLTTFTSTVIKNALKEYKWQKAHNGILIPRATTKILNRNSDDEISSRSYNRRVELYNAGCARKVVKFSDISENGYDPIQPENTVHEPSTSY